MIPYNRKALILTAVIGMSSAQAVFAQDVGPLRQFSGVIGVQSGSYSFYDLGKIQSEYLSRFSDRQIEQKNYVINSVKEINTQFEILLKVSIYGSEGLQTLHDSMVSSAGPVDYGSFLRAVRSYRLARVNFENALGSLAAIPGAIKSSTEVTAEKSGIVNLPGLLGGDTVDFTPIINHYNNQLKPILEMVDALKFNIATPNGPRSNVGLDFKPEIAYSPEVKAAKREEANRDLNRPSALNNAVERGMNVELRNLVNSFITTYGTAQKYRLAVGEQLQQRNKMLQDIEEFFFARSLLRLKFGVAVGAPEITYDIKKFNMDWLQVDTKDLISFTTATIFDDLGRLSKIRNDLEVALSTARSRAASLQAPSIENLLSKETVITMLNNVASTATFLAGNSQLALVNLWMIDLLKKDIEEEIAMQGGNGIARIEDLLTTHYFQEGSARQSRFQNLINHYDPDVAVRNPATGIMRTYVAVIIQMLNYQDIMRRAQVTLAEIEAADGINPLAQAGKSRLDKFRKK